MSRISLDQMQLSKRRSGLPGAKSLPETLLLLEQEEEELKDRALELLHEECEGDLSY